MLTGKSAASASRPALSSSSVRRAWPPSRWALARLSTSAVAAAPGLLMRASLAAISSRFSSEARWARTMSNPVRFPARGTLRGEAAGGRVRHPDLGVGLLLRFDHFLQPIEALVGHIDH